MTQTRFAPPYKIVAKIKFITSQKNIMKAVYPKRLGIAIPREIGRGTVFRVHKVGRISQLFSEKDALVKGKKSVYNDMRI